MESCPTDISSNQLNSNQNVSADLTDLSHRKYMRYICQTLAGSPAKKFFLWINVMLGAHGAHIHRRSYAVILC